MAGAMLGAAALPAWANRPAGGLPLPAPEALHYQIRYGGAPIGRQSLTFRQQANHLWVVSQTRMRIGLGPLSVYRFQQESHELWEDGRLAMLRTTTHDNGKDSAISGIAIEDGFAVTLREGTEIYPADIYTNNGVWNLDALKADYVLDVRDGELMRQSVETLGSDVIEIDGRALKVHRYAVQGETLAAQLWYDDSLLVKADLTRNSDTVEYYLRTASASSPAAAGRGLLRPAPNDFR
ncbi:MAG: DUF6134 family protein [Kiloniellales bacterium]